jgi:hypothetical protein
MSFLFEQEVNKAFKDSDLKPAINFLVECTCVETLDSKQVERLLTKAAMLNEFKHIETIFTALTKGSFLFDSIDYTYALRLIIMDR